MPTVADYLILRDAPFTLATGGDIDRQFDFSLDSDVRLNQSMILQFFVVSSQNASSLAFRSTVNGSGVRTIDVNGNFFCTVHEAFPGSVARQGQNQYAVSITSGTGRVEISDVVIWFQRDV